MANCLFTKLKAVVNNPNLPYFETMQQFTLDAITASGNASMTDAQKWALNHFFYKIGAIDNTALWQKVKMVALPVICGDNLSKALVNYVDNTNSGDATGSFDATHGFIGNLQSVGTSKYSGSSNGLAILWFPTKESLVLSNYNNGVQDTTNDGYVSVLHNVDNTFSVSWQQQAVRSEAKMGGFACVSSSSKVTTLLYENGVLNTYETEREREDKTISSKNFMISSKSDNPCGVSIVAYGVSVEELELLLVSAKTLTEAFVS